MSEWEATGKSDEWYTPHVVFDALGVSFDMDVAAPRGRRHVCVPANQFLTARSLDREWDGFVWMNPPFGGRNAIVPWLDKFWVHGNGIALTPDRTSAPWWQDAATCCSSLLLVSPKLRFVRPDGTEGKSPGSGTTLWASGDRAVLALRRAERRGLGTHLVRESLMQSGWC